MQKLYFFTGAGLSAASGIPTFRGTNGTWEDHDIDQVCNLRTWRNNFDLVHEFYNARRSTMNLYYPNLAHQAIAAWQAAFPMQTTIMTQNIDNLLEQAGCTNVIHLHGHVADMQCTHCGNMFEIGYRSWQQHHERCPRCYSSSVKPGVVFFEETAPNYVHYVRMLQHLDCGDMVVVIGTSGVVMDISTDLAGYSCKKILNNLESSEYINEAAFDTVLTMSAESAVPYIDTIIKEHFA